RDLGRPKVDAAADRLRNVNPHVDLVRHGERLEASNVRRLLEGYDLVLDGSDNFATRYLVNDAAVLMGIPVVWGAVLRFEGQISVFGAPGGPCYRCLFPEPPPPGSVPSCAEGGVLGVLPGIMGALQANEAIRWILGTGEPLIGRLMIFDALASKWREVRLRKDPECPTCGDGARPELVDLGATCPPVGWAEEEMMSDEWPFEIGVEELKRWMDEGRRIDLVDVREPFEYEICRIEGGRLLPLQQVPRRYSELGADDPGVPLVVYCHHGGRSAQAVQFLRSQGITHAINLGGGIDHWSLKIDPTTPRY
ncbi:MAG: ThiF family adenylyltransferase, partial [Acidobacteriota bacterium]